jgi:ribosomal protein S3
MKFFNKNKMGDSSKERKIKSLFITFFDGFYAEPKNYNTFAMGICKLEYKEKENELTVYLRRPGALIGTSGHTIDAIERHLDCKIKIVEVNLLTFK